MVVEERLLLYPSSVFVEKGCLKIIMVVVFKAKDAK